MEKIIIENRTDIGWDGVFLLIENVMDIGRVSGSGDKKQYTYYTTFNSGNRVVGVSAYKNKNSDRFVIDYDRGRDG